MQPQNPDDTHTSTQDSVHASVPPSPDSITEPAPFQSRPTNNEVPPKKRFPKWLIVTLIIFSLLFVLLAIAVSAIFSATAAPQKISDQFINDIQSGKTSAAYGLTSNSFKEATSEDQLDQLIKNIGPALQGEEKVSGRSIETSTSSLETAILVYDVKTQSGTSYIRVVLQKSGDNWQVVNFRADDKPLETKAD